MFYSEALLAKNGPLARVWLASNMERKLTKANVLHEKLEQKVADIIGTGQVPMALRMSGQLLLGVVRIYSKKAEYLKTDCNDVLLKIKMAFRPGNVDMTTSHSHAADKNALLLPDTITELDLFATLPDPDELLREPEARLPGRDPTLLDFGTSQLLMDSQHTPSKRVRPVQLDDDDLGLDLGLEPGEEVARATPFSEPSMEIGRRAHTPKRDEPSFSNLDDDLGLDMGYDDTADTIQPMAAIHDDDVPMLGVEDEYNNNQDNSDIAFANAAALARVDAATARRNQLQRDTASPLSSVHSSVERELEASFLHTHLSDHDHTTARAAQRIKRRKVLLQDRETEFSNAQIKAQQADRSAITKAPSFLPQNPLLLQLMEMQRNGGFVSGAVGDGRMQGWAPELRGILSVELVRGGAEKQKKRKRDSGVADLENPADEEAAREGATPRLQFPQEEDEGFHAVDFGADTTLPHSDGAMLINIDDHYNDNDLQPADDGQLDDPAPYDLAFDTTIPALLPPTHSGLIPVGTQSAVTLLRTHLAPKSSSSTNAPPTPTSRLKTSALFTDFCPEATTSRETATKLFFELLVLGSKDAVKISQEQGGKEGGVLGGAMRIRGCRGLWGEFGSQRGEVLGEEQEVGDEAGAAAS